MNALHIIDMSARGVLNIPHDVMDGIVADFPALQILGYRETVLPICRGHPSICDMPVRWEVDVDEAGWYDWYWLLQHDHLTDIREFLGAVCGSTYSHSIY